MFDPSTERYGFQEDDDEEGSGGFVAALLQEAMTDTDREETSFKISEPIEVEKAEDHTIGHTFDLNDPSDNERSDGEDEVRPDSVQTSRKRVAGTEEAGTTDEDCKEGSS